MTQIARCDWLPERARWSHLARSGLPAVSRKQNCPESHIINPSSLYWPSLLGQDGWVLASFFFCEFMDLDFVSIHKHAKKELGQYPTILTSHFFNNPYVLRRMGQWSEVKHPTSRGSGGGKLKTPTVRCKKYRWLSFKLVWLNIPFRGLSAKYFMWLFEQLQPVFLRSIMKYRVNCLRLHGHKSVTDTLNPIDIAKKFVCVNQQRGRHFGGVP